MTHFLSHWNVSPPTSPFDSLRYVLSPRPACWDAAAFTKKLPLTPARTCLCRYSSPSTRLRVLPFDQPSHFWSSMWLRFAHARLIAFVVLWPRGFTPLSLRTGRLVFDRYGFVSLLPALSRPSSCGPVAFTTLSLRTDRLVFCSSVWLRFAPARLIASVILWPRGLTTLSLRTGRLVFVRRCGFVSLLPALSRPSSCGPVAFLICSYVPPAFPLSSSRVLP